MHLSLFYFAFCAIVLLPKVEQTELSFESCPTSRRLLFFGGFNFTLGEKNTGHSSSSSKAASSSIKSSRTTPKHGVTVYIRPQTAAELGQKVRSFSHLLKPKLSKKTERTKSQRPKPQKKKQDDKKSVKKKDTIQQATKTRDLVAFNDEERDRCRVVLGIGQQSTGIPPKNIKKMKTTKPEKKTKPIKVNNNATVSTKKPVATTTKSSPSKNKKNKVKEAKVEKIQTKSTPLEKKKTETKPSETVKLTPTPTKQVPTKAKSSPPSSTSATPSASKPTPTTPAPPVSQIPTNTKTKREKPQTTTPSPKPTPKPEESTETLDDSESTQIDNDSDNHEKNNSVVDRAYHFVKNMFQLSDDILENNFTNEEINGFSSTNEEQHHQSRKLLSIDDETSILKSNDRKDCQINSHFNVLNDKQSMIPVSDLSLSYVSLSKRQLLSVKKNKRSIPTKDAFIKSKRPTSQAHKPKVGWAYRYRISRYLADQRMKRSGNMKRAIGGGRYFSKPIVKKMNSFSDAKYSKRNLLSFDDTDDESSEDEYQKSNQDIVNSVSITQEFVPKRQLFNSKKTNDHDDETDDEDDIEKINERRRMKSFEEITDPVEIVRSYDSGLFKPRVGWQFRYRVSRYIDTLRENIREDQERLKLGLEAIKRKTPQELSGRRKRVLDKPFESEPETLPPSDDNKPSVGWRYRYRISKMLEAKQRGEYIDDEEEKRKARESKRKQLGKGLDNDDECVEWEYDHLDPELRKINEEGRRVGWAYRYRIRRKLDFLKKQQEETGVSFDLETLTSELDKKVVEAPKVVVEEVVPEVPAKSVGWQYRYRVSKMREAQQREAEEAAARGSRKSDDDIPIHERLDPELARLTPAERSVGWQYRYRIRRKLDAMKDAARESHAGKRGKKNKSKDKGKEKIIGKVEESLEKILNIDDIDETPFMEYFRRTSSYVLFGLVPTGRKSLCLLPLPVTFPFCDETLDEEKKVTPKSPSSSSSSTSPPVTPATETTFESTKHSSTKKLRVKKEKRLKQTIPTRSIKSETTNEKVPEPVAKTPVKTPDKPQKKPARPRATPPSRYDEEVKHFDEEEQPIKKVIGVESQRNKNKKRYQIIGTEVKVKQRNSNVNSQSTTTTTATITTTSVPVTTKSPSVKKINTEVPKATSSHKSETASATRRTISEIVQEEAATLLSSKSKFSEEVTEEINEVNESLRLTTTPPTAATSSSNENNNEASDDENDESTSDETDSEGEIDSDEEEEDEEESTDDDNDDDDSDSSPMAKNKLRKNAKKGVHDASDSKDSS